MNLFYYCTFCITLTQGRYHVFRAAELTHQTESSHHTLSHIPHNVTGRRVATDRYK